MGFLLIVQFCWRSYILFFSVLRVSSFSLQYFSIVFNIFRMPSSLSENKTMSSAQKRELGWESVGLVDCISLSRSCGKSARNMLNRRGLSIHPCFTPKLTSWASVISSPYLIHILSWVYMFFIVLKKFPSMPKSRSFCKSMSRGIVSKALLKSIKQEYSHFLLLWHCLRTRLCIVKEPPLQILLFRR